MPPGPRPLEIQIPTESLVRIFTIADDQRQGNTTKTFFSKANTTYIASVLVLTYVNVILFRTQVLLQVVFVKIAY